MSRAILLSRLVLLTAGLRVFRFNYAPKVVKSKTNPNANPNDIGEFRETLVFP